MALTIALSLSLVAFAVVLAPLFQGAVKGELSASEAERLVLLARRDRYVEEVAEARLDAAMGKLPETELAALEARVEKALVVVLKQLDGLASSAAVRPSVP